MANHKRPDQEDDVGLGYLDFDTGPDRSGQATVGARSGESIVSTAMKHVLNRIATHIEDPKLFDFEADRDEVREFHKAGMACSFASWKVAKLLRQIADGLREVP